MMSNIRQRLGYLAISLICLSFAGCLGSEVKSLGTKSNGATSTPSTDADTFAITYAFREDANPADGRVVQLQGVRTNVAAGLTNVCGTSGTSCTCDFFQTGSTVVAATATAVGISKENNSFSCNIPGALAADSFDRVRFRTTDGKKMTGFIAIKTSLTLQQVIGDLNINKVNKIYKYSCQRTFFEGEGVSSTCTGGAASCINCRADVQQRLGLIYASYDYYLYDNKEGGGNKAAKFVSSFWPGICGRPDAEFARANCSGSVPDSRYGLYGLAAGPFTIRIQMTQAPEKLVDTAPDLTSTYGYAAPPDSAGNCPTGLTPVRPFMAQPASITNGSIDGANPSSNFLNIGNGTLNNTVIETAAPANFLVTRQENTTKCALVTGSCVAATFGGITTPQSVGYTALSPVVCVIPKALIDAI